MSKDVKVVSAGLGLYASIVAALIIQKLFGWIDASWFAVLSPLWMPLGSAAFMVLAICVLAFVDSATNLFDEWAARRSRD